MTCLDDRLRHLVAASRLLAEREYGPRSTYAVEAYGYLGLAMVYNDPAPALVAFEHAAQIAALRSANVDTAQVDFDTGRADQLLNRLEEGREKLEQALALWVRLDPSPANPQAMQIANGLADVLLDQGKTKEAHRLLDPARAAVETPHEKVPQWTDDATTLFELGSFHQRDAETACWPGGREHHWSRVAREWRKMRRSATNAGSTLGVLELPSVGGFRLLVAKDGMRATAALVRQEPNRSPPAEFSRAGYPIDPRAR